MKLPCTSRAKGKPIKRSPPLPHNQFSLFNLPKPTTVTQKS